jgi:hypothetical protein
MQEFCTCKTEVFLLDRSCWRQFILSIVLSWGPEVFSSPASV